MKKFFLLAVVLMLPLWVYSQAAQSTTEPGKDPVSLSDESPASQPALPIPQAIIKAESYMREMHMDLSTRYIQSVHLRRDDGSEKGDYWRIQWARSPAREDAEFALRIYMDGVVMSDAAGS